MFSLKKIVHYICESISGSKKSDTCFNLKQNKISAPKSLKWEENSKIHFLSNQIPWKWNNGISFTCGTARRRHMKFSKNCFWLFATQIEGCLNNLSDCTFKNSIWMTVTYKSPKLGLDPLYLYSCNSFPLLWLM